MIELSYEVEADENGVYDGRKVARRMIADAYRLVVPYVAGCPACTDALVSTIANEVIEEIWQDKDEEGKLKGFLLAPGASQDAVFAHMAAAEASTRQILEGTNRSAPREQDSTSCPASDVDDHLPF